MKGLVLYETIAGSQTLRLRREGYFNLVWGNKCYCKLNRNQENYRISTGQMLLLPPELDFQLTTQKGGEGVCLSFSIEYLQVEAKVFVMDIFRLYIAFSANRVMSVSDTIFNRINKISDLLTEVYSDEESAAPITYSFLNAILLSLIQTHQVTLSLPDKNIERLYEFFVLVYNNCIKEKSVTFYANQLNISVKRLNQVLHIFSVHSASYFIQENIIMEAKRLMLDGKLNINEIAFQLGYEDVAYFSRFFKKWTGLPPERYRKKYYYQTP